MRGGGGVVSPSISRFERVPRKGVDSPPCDRYNRRNGDAGTLSLTFFWLAVFAIGASFPTSVARGYVIVIVNPPTPQPLVAPTCTVAVCCKGLPFGSGIAWHCFTKCTRTTPDGGTEVIACCGNPTGLLRDLWPEGVRDSPNGPPNCDGWGLGEGAWGPIDTYCGPYIEGHPDWRRNQPPCAASIVGTDCGTCDCIRDVMCQVEACCVRYELIPELAPGGYNSNSTAFTALELCKPSGAGPPVLPLGAPVLGVPGWGTPIPLSGCPVCPQP